MQNKGLRDIVESALAYTPGLVEKDIDVATHGGVVTLTGHVPSYNDRLEAEKVVKRLRGVKAIANDLEVRLPGSSKRNDTDIAEAAVSALKWRSTVPEDKIKVTVRNAWITLEGDVEWRYQKDAAEKAVRGLTGVKGVRNMLKVKPEVEPEQVKEKIARALERSARLDAGRIQIETQGHKVILRGTVHSWHEHDEAEEAAWAVPGVWEVEDHLTVNYG